MDSSPPRRRPPVRPCPRCHGEGAASAVIRSDESHVLIYRCALCGHVWNVVAPDRDGPIVWHD
jgi:uncharacterized Zn finger protein